MRTVCSHVHVIMGGSNVERHTNNDMSAVGQREIAEFRFLYVAPLGFWV